MWIKRLINSVITDRTPDEEKNDHLVKPRNYNRAQRKRGQFVVKIGYGFVVMTKASPFEYDLETSPDKGDWFSYVNAVRITDETLAKRPMIYMVSSYRGKILLT